MANMAINDKDFRLMRFSGFRVIADRLPM